MNRELGYVKVVKIFRKMNTPMVIGLHLKPGEKKRSIKRGTYRI